MPDHLNIDNIEEKNTQMSRQQTILFNNNEKIAFALKRLTDFYLNLMKEKMWSELKINCYTVNNFISIIGKNNTGEIDNTEIFIINTKIEASKIFRKIREDMYTINPTEGAWYDMTIYINETNTVSYFFNYDVESSFLKKIC